MDSNSSSNATEILNGKRRWPLEEDERSEQALLEQHGHAPESKRLPSSELRAQTPGGGGCCENVRHLSALHDNASKNVPEVVFNDLDAPLNCRNVPFQSQIAGADVDLLSPNFSELSLFAPPLL
jgi:hypothetical protein